MPGRTHESAPTSDGARVMSLYEPLHLTVQGSCRCTSPCTCRCSAHVVVRVCPPSRPTIHVGAGPGAGPRTRFRADASSSLYTPRELIPAARSHPHGG